MEQKVSNKILHFRRRHSRRVVAARIAAGGMTNRMKWEERRRWRARRGL